jgi:cyclopropane-fatty-acyl-phospholipid synthase
MSRESVVPSPARSLPARASRLDRLALRLVAHQLGSVTGGPIVVRLPDGSRLVVGSGREPEITLQVDDWSFFRRVVAGADIGAGEAYMDGHWRCDDLAGLMRRVVEGGGFALPATWWERLGARLQAMGRFRNANTLRGSRRNIARHYDLGNDLYRLFLDETMMYSCAEFAGPGDEDLRAAQERKLEGICRRLEIGPQHHVLEIGSGWGGFALHAAATRGCRVTTLTLSREQQALVRERAAAAGLADRIDVQFCDYREHSGTYDRLVSIEMFEAVGFAFYRAYFEAVQRLLQPGGRMFLQTITVPDRRFDEYRRGFDFIRKHIFPGGLLASLHEVIGTLRRHTSLEVDWLRDIGPDYATTLRLWRERFLASKAEVGRLGYDERFVRMWEFYLASCEALFAARAIGDAQLVLRRAG